MNAAYYKYIIGHFLSPFSVLLLTAIFCYVLLLLNKHTRLIKTTMGLSLMCLYGISTNFGADLLLAPLEFKYAKFQQPKRPLSYIVVLGCNKSSHSHLPISSQLHSCSQIRLQEGINIYGANPHSKLIITGGTLDGKASIAQMMADSAIAMGINENDIIILSKPNNTETESQLVSSYILGAPTALVTSAAHMPRAIALFSAQGVDLIPAPTDFLIREKVQQAHLRYFIPESKNLEKVTSAFHEYYGMLWLQLKRQF